MDAPTNNPVQTVDEILNFIINTVGANAAIIAAQTYLPFLKLPVISQLFSWFVKWLNRQTFNALKGYVNFEIINFQNDSERADYDKAVANLQRAVLTGDKDAIKFARDQASYTLDKLINFNH